MLCGMTIPAGKTFNLEKDLVCTTATAGKGNTAVAITIEEGATLNCNGHHVTQLNDEVGKAVECTDDPVTVTGCGLAWGASGVELKSGARFENCRVSGWQYGLLIAPPADGYADEIKIDNCEVTLNRYGLYAFAQDELDVLDFSIEIENRYVYLLLYDLSFILFYLLEITLTHSFITTAAFGLVSSFFTSFLQLFSS